MANKADAVTKAIDSFIAKVRDIKFKAKVDDADIEKLTDDRKKLIGHESKLLEDHRKANKEHKQFVYALFTQKSKTATYAET